MTEKEFYEKCVNLYKNSKKSPNERLYPIKVKNDANRKEVNQLFQILDLSFEWKAVNRAVAVYLFKEKKEELFEFLRILAKKNFTTRKNQKQTCNYTSLKFVLNLINKFEKDFYKNE